MSASTTTFEDFDDDDLDDPVYACTYCHGTGMTVEGWDCEECDGYGYWDF